MVLTQVLLATLVQTTTELSLRPIDINRRCSHH